MIPLNLMPFTWIGLDPYASCSSSWGERWRAMMRLLVVISVSAISAVRSSWRGLTFLDDGDDDRLTRVTETIREGWACKARVKVGTSLGSTSARWQHSPQSTMRSRRGYSKRVRVRGREHPLGLRLLLLLLLLLLPLVLLVLQLPKKSGGGVSVYMRERGGIRA